MAAYLGFRVFNGSQSFRLTRWLYAQVLTSPMRPSVLFDLATAHLVAQRVVLPGVTVLARLIARVRERTGRHLRNRLNPVQQKALESLLVVPPSQRLTRLEALRTAPTRVSGPALVAALGRLDHVCALGVGNISLHDLPEARLVRLIRHAHMTWGQTLARMGEERRLATLLAFAQALERTATDDVLDLFDGLMTSLALRDETKRRQRLRSLKDLDHAALVLQQARCADDRPGQPMRPQVLLEQRGQRRCLLQRVRQVNDHFRDVGLRDVEAGQHLVDVLERLADLGLKVALARDGPSVSWEYWPGM